MTVSYLSDAPRDMLEATIALVRGGTYVTFVFMDEPGKHEWRVQVQRDGSVDVRILWFSDYDISERSAQRVFHATSTVPAFAREVCRCMRRILEKHGRIGYRERWSLYPFPVDQLKVLQELINGNR